MKEVIHAISFESISERPTSKSFHELSAKSVKIGVISTFWQATTRVLCDITWIGSDKFTYHEQRDICVYNMKWEKDAKSTCLYFPKLWTKVWLYIFLLIAYIFSAISLIN